ncbi:MAG: hypothetical protein AB1405_13645 [Bdellovibrionota bacterium]
MKWLKIPLMLVVQNLERARRRLPAVATCLILVTETFVPVFLIYMGLMMRPAKALACAVCFGAPDSEMVKAANAGVAFLLLVIFFVLAWVGGMILFFIHRAKKLRSAGGMEGAETAEGAAL